jgi:Protein of unknown function DUF72
MRLPMRANKDMDAIMAGGEKNIRRWLPLQLQAWSRHGIHVGIACSQRGLRRHLPSIRTACIDIAPVRDMPQGIDIVVGMSCDVMWYRYPHRHHSVIQRGELNRDFLDPVVLRNHFLPMIRTIRKQLSAILLPVAHIYPTEQVSVSVFVERLHACLAGLPREHRYAVELMNPEYLLPEYFDCLKKHAVAHVLNNRMPVMGLLDQIQLPHVLTSESVLARVEADATPETLLGIVETVRRCVDEKKQLYLYLYDEDNVLECLGRLMDLLDPSLARLSPLRREAA